MAMEECYHYALGNLPGSNGHSISVGKMWLKGVETEYQTVLGNWNWACSICGIAQHGDNPCCELEAKEHIIAHFKTFAELIVNMHQGHLGLNEGKVWDPKDMTEVFLSPH